ncbi:MAG TPA: amino acid ABC transporter permease [Clostridia bacterium]|nr:amino acid ABC transporter permease [Clostridia bacterium]
MDSLQFIWSVLPVLLKGMVMTVQLAVLAILFGTLVGLLIALLKIDHRPWLNKIGGFYTWFFRGIPLLVQLIFLYYGLPAVGIVLTPYQAAVIGLSLCGGAYIAEIIRAGIQSIEKGQMEAALSLGMTYGQAMRRVIIPQTYRRLLPPMGNEFITLLKDVSLVSVITMVDLLRSAQLLNQTYFRPFELYATVAVIYLILTSIFTVVVGYLEKKLTLPE